MHTQYSTPSPSPDSLARPGPPPISSAGAGAATRHDYPEARLPATRHQRDCDAQRCTYHAHYLTQGPAELGHGRYHTLEREYAGLMREAIAWDAAYPHRRFPLETLVQRYETRLRI